MLGETEREADRKRKGQRERETDRKRNGGKMCWLLRRSWHRMFCSWPLVGLCKLYPLRGKICGGWTVETPSSSYLNFSLLSFTLLQEFSIHLFDPPPSSMSSCVTHQDFLLILLTIFIPLFYEVVFPPWSHYNNCPYFIHSPPCPSQPSTFVPPHSSPYSLSLPTVMLFSAVPGGFI